MSTRSDAPRARAIPLPRRLAWASAARLVLLTVLLGVITLVNVRGEFTVASYSVQLGMATLVTAFALSAVYTWFLRRGQNLTLLVVLQLVLDQVIWTVVVYLSGGISSGATSFYGVTCFFGAILAGYRGAWIAAASAGVCYASLATALANGWLTAPPDQPSSAYAFSAEELLYSSVVNFLMLLVVVLLAGTLAERLRATGGQLVRAQARADQAEREAALGRLAAGLAHEIRNPLGSISGSVRLLEVNPTLSPDERQLCQIIRQEAERLNDLVSDMLNLSKPKTPEPVVLDIATIAQEVTSLAQHSGRASSDVQVVYRGEQTLTTLADDAMLRQMLWNLVRNAVQASSAGQEVVVRADLVSGEIVVSVSDAGAGLSDEAKEKIFDAFFTTRSKGTGIGLAVVKRIADDHGWSIEVEDTEGGGATFRVWMGAPIDEQANASAQKKPSRWTLFPKPGE